MFLKQDMDLYYLKKTLCRFFTQKSSIRVKYLHTFDSLKVDIANTQNIPTKFTWQKNHPMDI